MVSHLLNIDDALAGRVGTGLGLKAMPKPADAAMPTRQDLDPSPKLSIVENGPQRFEGRKLGILVTDGTDAAMVKALKRRLQGRRKPSKSLPESGRGKGQRRQLDRGRPDDRRRPLGIVRRGRAAAGRRPPWMICSGPTARDFVADAFAHCKFIGHVKAAAPLFAKAGIADSIDEGFIALARRKMSQALSASSASCDVGPGAQGEPARSEGLLMNRLLSRPPIFCLGRQASIFSC